MTKSNPTTKTFEISVTNPPSTQSILRKAIWSLFAFSVAITLGVWIFWGDSVDELLAQMEPSKFGWALLLLSMGLPTVAMQMEILAGTRRKETRQSIFYDRFTDGRSFIEYNHPWTGG